MLILLSETDRVFYIVKSRCAVLCCAAVGSQSWNTRLCGDAFMRHLIASNITTVEYLPGTVHGVKLSEYKERMANYDMKEWGGQSEIIVFCRLFKVDVVLFSTDTGRQPQYQIWPEGQFFSNLASAMEHKHFPDEDTIRCVSRYVGVLVRSYTGTGHQK